jgi:hypothetical protein
VARQALEISGGRVPRAQAIALAVLLLTACTVLPSPADGGKSPSPPPQVSTPVTPASSAPASTAVCHPISGGALPDPQCTPGALDPAVTPDPAVLGRTICKPGWSNLVRPKDSAALKQRVLRRYGIEVTTVNLARYEMDHRVPLEVGGAPRDLNNLWPEPWEMDASHPQGDAPAGTGAQSKDKIENRIRAAICGGRVTLQEGQKVFLGDWSTS